jgi:xanthine dehydrogenase YagR molybdenum-binding subunit
LSWKSLVDRSRNMRLANQPIGASINRVEGQGKVTGRAKYSADHETPGVTYAVLVQSEIPHGRISADSLAKKTQQILAAPGVLHVLTPLNCPMLNVLPRDLTFDLPLERRPPLSDLTIQHVGQHVALVIADSPENASYAASLLELDYEPLPALLHFQDVFASVPEPDEKNGQIRHGSYLPDHFVKLEEEKLQDARGELDEPHGVSISARYITSINAHYPIELSSTIASWQGDTLTLYDSTRWITGERKALAGYLAIPEDKIHILSPLVGGAFGSKSFLWMHVALAAVAAREIQRPVKLVLTREQMFSSTGHRPRTQQDISLVVDATGKIQSSAHHTVTETSTVGHFCEPTGLSTRFLYHSPRMVVSHRVARINSPTPCFMRGPGEAPGLFALEVAMDELAYEVGLDPLELRRRNHVDFDQASGKPWSSKHLLECYDEAASRFGWEQRIAAPRSMLRNGALVGWGMATATYPGRRMSAGCRVMTDASGKLHFSSATHEVGNGVRTVMTQIAAQTVGIPVEAITFSSGDSYDPDAPYSGASQTTATVGSAVYQAAAEWKRRGLQLLVQNPDSKFFAANPDELDLEDGVIRFKAAPAPSEPYQMICDSSVKLSQTEALNFDASSTAGEQKEYAFQSFGTHFCEVEVDEEIGRATVTRWVATFDCGRVLNPKLATNQIMGGVIFGLGMALLEQVPYDPKTAQLIGEYYLPTHADRPDFDISFIEYPDYLLSPMGARGIGEIGICGVPAAIANAIFHATGKRLRQLPITIEHLMQPFGAEATNSGAGR